MKFVQRLGCLPVRIRIDGGDFRRRAHPITRGHISATFRRARCRRESLQLDVRCLDHLPHRSNLVVHVSGRLFGRAAKKISADSFLRPSCISGWRRASFTSALILSTMVLGVSGGATFANQATDSKPGSVSAIVGTSGREDSRWAEATANSRQYRRCGVVKQQRLIEARMSFGRLGPVEWPVKPVDPADSQVADTIADWRRGRGQHPPHDGGGPAGGAGRSWREPRARGGCTACAAGQRAERRAARPARRAQSRRPRARKRPSFRPRSEPRHRSRCCFRAKQAQ